MRFLALFLLSFIVQGHAQVQLEKRLYLPPQEGSLAQKLAVDYINASFVTLLGQKELLSKLLTYGQKNHFLSQKNLKLRIAFYLRKERTKIISQISGRAVDQFEIIVTLESTENRRKVVVSPSLILEFHAEDMALHPPTVQLISAGMMDDFHYLLNSKKP